MQIKGNKTGYVMKLSARDTHNWAYGHDGFRWPCSELADHRVVICVDSNGLCNLTIDGGRGDQDVSSDELAACVFDHLPKHLRHLWPTWE